jgi:hypothetical protein
VPAAPPDAGVHYATPPHTPLRARGPAFDLRTPGPRGLTPAPAPAPASAPATAPRLRASGSLAGPPGPGPGRAGWATPRPSPCEGAGGAWPSGQLWGHLRSAGPDCPMSCEAGGGAWGCDGVEPHAAPWDSDAEAEAGAEGEGGAAGLRVCLLARLGLRGSPSMASGPQLVQAAQAACSLPELNRLLELVGAGREGSGAARRVVWCTGCGVATVWAVLPPAGRPAVLTHARALLSVLGSLPRPLPGRARPRGLRAHLRPAEEPGLRSQQRHAQCAAAVSEERGGLQRGGCAASRSDHGLPMCARRSSALCLILAYSHTPHAPPPSTPLRCVSLTQPDMRTAEEICCELAALGAGPNAATQRLIREISVRCEMLQAAASPRWRVLHV